MVTKVAGDAGSCGQLRAAGCSTCIGEMNASVAFFHGSTGFFLEACQLDFVSLRFTHQ